MKLIHEGYERKGRDLVLNKKFIWQLLIGLVTVVFIPFNILIFMYIFLFLFFFYSIYTLYYFKNKEKDLIRVVIDENMQTEGSNNENSFTINEFKKDPSIEKKEKRKNEFFFLVGTIVSLIGLSLILFGEPYIMPIPLIVLIIGLVPLLQGAYGLYVK